MQWATISQQPASSLRFLSLLTTASSSPAQVLQWRATMIFSATVMPPNSRMFWKVRLMPSFVICSGFFFVMFFPSNQMLPEVLGVMPVRRL